MAKPIAIAKGIALAFPDVCKTPAPPAPPIPIPYPNIALLDQADAKTENLKVGSAGDPVLLAGAQIMSSTGDEAGSVGGVKSGIIKGACQITEASKTVIYGPGKKGLVRFLDKTSHNKENAVGVVLSAFPTVLVGD